MFFHYQSIQHNNIMNHPPKNMINVWLISQNNNNDHKNTLLINIGDFFLVNCTIGCLESFWNIEILIFENLKFQDVPNKRISSNTIFSNIFKMFLRMLIKSSANISLKLRSENLQNVLKLHLKIFKNPRIAPEFLQ